MPSASRHPYLEPIAFDATLRGQALRVIAKPGLPTWDRVPASMALLADAVQAPADARVLLLGCGHGALAVALARLVPQGSVLLMDPSALALAMARRTLAANAIGNAQIQNEISVLPRGAGSFDVVVIDLPQGRALARRWLVEAHTALRPGGQLYLAGPNDQGVQPAIEDARALFGNAALLRYKARNRVARAVKNLEAPAAPAWAGEPGVAPGTWREFDLVARGQPFRLRSLPGVFSYDRLDAGTALLLEHLDLPAGARVLDAGCGYGIIGLLAARLGASRVDLIDVDLLAVASARENIALNGVVGARALAGDLLEPVARERYDLVVSNPPFHAGKAVDYDAALALVALAPDVLEPGGRLMLVANAFIRYERAMRERFAHVERIAGDGRYQVLVAC